MNDPVISVIDDDEATRDALVDLMRAKGLDACCYASAEEFLGSEAHWSSRCIVTDIQMPGMSGIDLKRRLDAEDCRTPVIMITARLEQRIQRQVADCGAFCFLAKPFPIGELFACVQKALASGEAA